MKKMFLICCTAVSVLALSTSANTGRYNYSGVSVVCDTVPPMMSDTMHHGAIKMHKRGKTTKDTGMHNMRTDTTSTTPPKK